MNDKAVLTELAQLQPGTTMCPGALARRLGGRQRDIRPVLAELALERKIVVSQQGEARDLRTLRGPYRVALAAPQDGKPIRAASSRSRS